MAEIRPEQVTKLTVGNVTLRDFYAGVAMLAYPIPPVDAPAVDECECKRVATWAYDMAAAMMVERANRNGAPKADGT